MEHVNKEMAIKRGLVIDGDSSKYDNLVKIYKYLLEYYIDSKIDLFKYDKLIRNSGLYIGVNGKYRLLNEYLNLDYIFVINNLFVEKLSNEEIDLLLTKFDKRNVSDELINIVERTFKNVIYDNFLQGQYQNIVYKVCYGPAVSFNMVDNDALVFKIYYGKNLIEMDGEKFIELHKKQLSFFDEIINNLKNEIKIKLGIKCEILLQKDLN